MRVMERLCVLCVLCALCALCVLCGYSLFESGGIRSDNPMWPSISRRQFVKAASAALAAPMIVSSSVFGADGKTAPSNRITVGFIGCGKMANDYHLPELLGFADVQAVAVCEVDAKRREHAKARVEKAYSEGNRAMQVYATCQLRVCCWS